MKNVLIISSTHTASACLRQLASGDMRKGGNSDTLCDEFEKGAINGMKYLTAAYKLGLKVK